MNIYVKLILAFGGGYIVGMLVKKGPPKGLISSAPAPAVKMAVTPGGTPETPEPAAKGG